MLINLKKKKIIDLRNKMAIIVAYYFYVFFMALLSMYLYKIIKTIYFFKNNLD